MNRYQPGTPRTTLGVAALALTALTIGVLVVAPATMDAAPSQALTLARLKNVAPPPTEVRISPARIEVIGARDRTVVIAAEAPPRPKVKPAS